MSYYAPHIQVTTSLGRPSSTSHIVVAWVVTVFTSFYTLPWAIAATRSKRDMTATVLVNVLLGWTVIGWIVALVMACSGPTAHQRMVISTQVVNQIGYGYPAAGYPSVAPYVPLPDPRWPYYPVAYHQPTRPAALPAIPEWDLRGQPTATEITQPLWDVAGPYDRPDQDRYR